MRWFWKKRDSKAGSPGVPRFRHPQLVVRDSPFRQFRRFMAAIPPRVRQAVEPFYYRRDMMLRIVAESRAGEDLLYSNPMLLWLIANVADTGRCTPDQIQNFLRMKQRQTLWHLTGNDSEAAVRFLRKLTMRNGDYLELRLIKRTAGQEPVVRKLSHFSTIPVHMLAVVAEFPEITQTGLLQEIVRDPPQKLAKAVLHAMQLRESWADTLALAHRLGIGGVEAALGRCTTAQQLEQLRERWRAQVARRRGEEGSRFCFPPPPVRGTETIQPIRDEEALREEGRVMEHCVASLGAGVLAGRSYFYRVLAPERATLELAVNAGVARIARLCLKANRAPGPATWAAVNAWLRQHVQALVPNEPAVRPSFSMDRNRCHWRY